MLYSTEQTELLDRCRRVDVGVLITGRCLFDSLEESSRRCAQLTRQRPEPFQFLVHLLKPGYHSHHPALSRLVSNMLPPV